MRRLLLWIRAWWLLGIWPWEYERLVRDARDLRQRTMLCTRWVHEPDCDDRSCYCLNLSQPVGICTCGRPLWVCQCDEDRWGWL